MNCWQILQQQFYKDFTFTGKYPEINTVLQRIREIIFTDICKKRSSPLVCDDHVHLIWSSPSLEIDKIFVPCCKVERDLKNPDSLEEIRILDIKKPKEVEIFRVSYPITHVAPIITH
jgi:hypothetical protein